MQSLSTAYTVYYNLRHQRHGHLFDGRYKAKVVEGDPSSPRLRRAGGYLRALSRYVHLNPVHVGSIKRKPIEDRIRYLRNYEWSSYPTYVEPRPTFSFVDSAPLLGTRGRSRREKQKQYREFVESGLAEEDKEIKAALTESPRSIGGEAFRITIDDMYRSVLESRRRPEDVAFRRVTEPLDPEVVLEALADEFGVPVEAFRQRRRNSPLRAVAAQALIRFSGQTQREIADRLGMTTGGAVSAQLRRLPDLLEDDRGLRRRVRRVERKLTESRRRGAED